MSIDPKKLYPPLPSAMRARLVHLSYDPVHDRLVYPLGKSVMVKPLDPNNTKLPTRQFTKHTFPVTSATFSPNGNYVASGDDQGQIKIWDVAVVAGEESMDLFDQPTIKSEFQVLSGAIRSIAWDGDGTRIIAVGLGKEKFGHCFSWDSGNSIGEIQGHSSTINAVAIKPQRPYRAATVGDDKGLVFFHGPPFKFDRSVRGHHSNTIRDVKFSPDGRWLVSCGSDRLLCLYDGKTGELIKKEENAHNGGIFAISWFLDSLKFVTCSADNTLNVWDAESLSSTKTFHVNEEASIEDQQVGVVVAKEYIVSLSLLGKLNYFINDSNKPAFTVSGHQHPLTVASLDPEGNAVLTGGFDGSIYKWDLSGKDKTELAVVPQQLGVPKARHLNYISGIVAKGKEIITSGWDDTVKIWENSVVKSTTNLKLGQPKQIAQDDSGLVLVLYESAIEAFKPVSGSLESVAQTTLNASASAFSLVPGSFKLIVTNLTTNSLEEYDYSSSAISKLSAATYPPGRSPPSLVRVSPNGALVAVSDTSGKYTLYNVADKSVVTTRWAFHSSRVSDCKWTPDSKFLVSGGLDSAIYLYSVEKPSKVLKFPLAHQNGVSGLEWLHYEFEPSKKGSFVSTGLDAVIKTWDVDLGAY